MYWQDRQKQLNKALEKDEAKVMQRISKAYSDESARLEKEIASYFAKYGDGNVIRYRNLMQALPESEKTLLIEKVEDFVAKYPQYSHLVPVRESIYKLDRLQGLQYSITMEQYKIGAISYNELQKHLEAVALRGANATAETLGMGVSFYKEDANLIKTIVNTKWSDGANFSDRIWSNTDKLAKKLNTEVAQGFARGDSYDKLVKALKNDFNVGTNQAKRLVFTEGTFVNNESQAKLFEEQFGYYKVVCIKDGKTCDLCKAVSDVSEEYPIRYQDREVGVNAPPFHAWCRCGEVPVIADKMAWMREYVNRGGSPVDATKIMQNLTGEQFGKKVQERLLAINQPKSVFQPQAVKPAIRELIEFEKTSPIWESQVQLADDSRYKKYSIGEWYSDRAGYQYDFPKDFTIDYNGASYRMVYATEESNAYLLDHTNGELTWRTKAFRDGIKDKWQFIGSHYGKFENLDTGEVLWEDVVLLKKRSNGKMYFVFGSSHATSSRIKGIPQALKDRVSDIYKQLWDKKITFSQFRTRAGDEFQDAMREFHSILHADDLPTVVTKEAFEANKNPVLYRGISESSGLRTDIKNTMSSKQMGIQFMEKDLFPSRGIYGDGAAYTSTSRNFIARSYAKSNIDDGTCISMKLKADAKTIKYDDAVKLFNQINAEWEDENLIFSTNQRRTAHEVGKAMNTLGYDAIIEPNGDGTGVPFYVILNRGALEITEDYIEWSGAYVR